MDTQMILTKLSLIFQEILKRDNIVLTNETTAQDVEGWNSLTNMILIRFKNVGDICNAILTKTK